MVTATAHGCSNGDFVLIECEGMIEINNGVLRWPTWPDTFQLVGPDGATGIDTTNYNAFTSAPPKKLTLGTSITGVQGFSPPVATSKQDSTTVHDLHDKELVVGVTALSYDLDLQVGPSNAGQAAMKAAM